MAMAEQAVAQGGDALKILTGNPIVHRSLSALAAG
jgi:hypothetical protein